MIYKSIQPRRISVLIVSTILTGSILIVQESQSQTLSQSPANKISQSESKESESQKPITEAIRQRGYIGVGGSIGLSGNTSALGTGGFSLFSKTVFTDNLSMHNNTVIFGTGISSSSSNLTVDFPIRDASSQQIIVSPFIGGGVMFRNENGLKIAPHVTGGVDVPISRNIMGTVQLNVGLPSDRKADMGLLLGVGYSF
ncbi:hypothetical protein H6F42_11845 [Pseudanabaena sp. FACHB-1998]|uniref:hypothetical protein n=1 Tax=Pseudanabaena sp. FACHB-1998 TaxID=2692858 RepID=UPI0016804D6A|nr:hypothetical protein [Pseudanabaena sp. FACHB-1998]MBD2177605.1 hypothetical protein [Pseudanabaena sp. FACHB-1998]